MTERTGRTSSCGTRTPTRAGRGSAHSRAASSSNPRRAGWSVVVLAASLFTYLAAEMFPVAALPELAAGLDISSGRAGALLSGYAVVAGLASVPVVALTRRWDRRVLLSASMVLLALSVCGLALSQNFHQALVARSVGALTHGVVWALAPVVAGELAAPAGRGRARSRTFLGSSLSLVASGPLLALISQHWGWRVASAGLAALAVVVAALLWLVLPSLPSGHGVRADEPLTRRAPAAQPPPESAGAAAPVASGYRGVVRGVAMVCTVTVGLVVAHYVSYTYLAVLLAEKGIEGPGFGLALFGYGVAGLAGVLLCGRLLDAHPFGLALTMALTMAAALVVLATDEPFGVAIALLGWAMAFSAAPAILQDAVVRAAGRRADVASAIYVVAFQIGISGGAALGGRLLGQVAVPVLWKVSCVLAVLAAVLVGLGRGTFRRSGHH